MKPIVVVTGGSDGLGKSIVKTLSGMNTVIALGRSEKKLKSVSEMYYCSYHVCDISSPKEVHDTISEIINEHKRIDVLVNSAGVYLKGRVEKNTIEEIFETFTINTIGPVLLIREVLPFMKRQDKGIIINIISKDGLYSKPDRSVYGASKWGLTGFTHNLQQDLAKSNIRVTGIYPGRIDTNMFSKKYPKEKVSRADLIKPDEIAKLIEFILSQKDTTLYPSVVIKHKDN